MVSTTSAWAADPLLPGLVCATQTPLGLLLLIRDPSNLAADAVLEPTNGGLLPQDMGHRAPESSLSPPVHSRSATSSPPRMSAEQRELKRQHERARRDSKLSARIQRPGSQRLHRSYEVTSPPSTQGEFARTSSMSRISSMPVHTTAPTDISLLTESTTLEVVLVLLTTISLSTLSLQP